MRDCIDPFPGNTKGGSVQCNNPFPSRLCLANRTRSLQHAQVLGHGLHGNGERPGKFANRRVPLRKLLQHGPSRRIAEG